MFEVLIHQQKGEKGYFVKVSTDWDSIKDYHRFLEKDKDIINLEAMGMDAESLNDFIQNNKINSLSFLD